jgi:hypothetical protein
MKALVVVLVTVFLFGAGCTLLPGTSSFPWPADVNQAEDSREEDDASSSGELSYYHRKLIRIYPIYKFLPPIARYV